MITGNALLVDAAFQVYILNQFEFRVSTKIFVKMPLCITWM